jgi:hypothetical protein
MNTFQLNYDVRLKSWHDLRIKLEKYEVNEKCIEVDKFWQQCPIASHYLHPVDILDWPNPWELIFDNNYCMYSRALGMIYTLLLLGINDIDLVEAKDDNDEDVVLVLVNNAKYILNYWPNTVVNNCLTNFNITRYLDITHIIKKTGST